MKTKLRYFTFCFLLISTIATPQSKNRVLLMNGTAHIGNGQVIEMSYITFSNGKLDMVSDVKGIKINPASFDTIIDISGKHVYPGVISTNNILGLQEAEAIRPTSDYNEVGYINPHVRSLIAYNTDSKIIPTVKSNGVLYTQCTPRNGLMSGSSSVLATDGWNWEDAVLRPDDGVHVNFPKAMQKRGWWAEPEPSSKNNRYDEEMNSLTRFFEDAAAYCNSATGTFENNLRFEAMRNVFNGKQNLYLHTDDAKDIILAVNFSKKFQIKKPVIVGGKDSWKITGFLRENKIPVMLNRIHDLPEIPEADVDIVYRTPFLLEKDSVLFCLQIAGDMEAMQSRNVPFLAGTAVAYGMSKEKALQAITLNAAKILGVESQVGSLEAGKIASLVVSEGDLLDMKANNVILAFINGKPVKLYNDQQALYEKYKSKYGLK